MAYLLADRVLIRHLWLFVHTTARCSWLYLSPASRASLEIRHSTRIETFVQGRYVITMDGACANRTATPGSVVSSMLSRFGVELAH